ncbi:hypothetical protein D3C85_1350400 [compost metagenome]
MGAGDDNVVICSCQREVLASLVSRHQLHNLFRTARRESHVDTGVAGISRAEIPFKYRHDGRHRIKQANKVDAKASACVPIKLIAKHLHMPGPDLRQVTFATLGQIVGKMTGCGRASTKAKKIELQANDACL